MKIPAPLTDCLNRVSGTVMGGVFWAVLLVSMPAFGDAYRDARRELIAAYQAGDTPAMVAAAERGVAARPGFPAGEFNLALAKTLDGDPHAALAILASLAGRGIDFGVADADEFETLRALDGWPQLAHQLARLEAPVGEATVAARLDSADFIPEGIAIDRNGALYLGSIRKGIVVRAGGDPEIVSAGEGHWSVFGMRFHADGSLWFASSAVPQFAAAGEDTGKAGLFRLDTASGTLTRSAILPPFADEQVLGDLVIAAADTIYTTDSIGGSVYRYSIAADAFEALLPAGSFISPQGLALAADGRHLYVADYNGGLYRVSTSDGERRKIAMPDNLTDYGIDGLYRHGRQLIAIQNGIRPHRVVALDLADDGLSVTGGRILAANLEHFDEPTLGTVAGDDFYFVANSHWNRFDGDNALPDGLSGPIVLRISLAP